MERLSSDKQIETGLTQAQIDEAIVSLMTGKKIDGGIMYSWRNIDKPDENGHSYYEKFIQNDLYQQLIIQPSLKLIEKHKETIKNVIQKGGIRQIRDRGVGNDKAGKVSDIIIGNQVNNLEYLPVDVSDTACIVAQESMKKRGYTISKKHVDNFFGTKMSDDAESPLHLCLGLTAGNFSGYHKIVDQMSSPDYHKGSYVMMDYALAPDPAADDYDDQIMKLKAAYGDPDDDNPYKDSYAVNRGEKMIGGAFEALGFDIGKLEVAVQHSQEGISFGMKVREGECIQQKMGSSTYVRTSSDDPMWLVTSPRVQQAIIEKKLIKAGQTTKKKIQFSDTAGGVGLLLFQKPRKSIKKSWKSVDKRIKNTLYIALAAATIGAGGYQIGKHQQQKQQQEKMEQQIKNTLTNFAPSVMSMNDDYTVEDKKTIIQSELKDITLMLQDRYHNTLSPDMTQDIYVSYLDWMQHNNIKPEKHNMRHNANMMYSPYLFYPSQIEEFIYSHANALVQNGITITPNTPLLEYPEALSNTFHYTGERQVFDEVDEQLPDYVKPVVSRSMPDGDPNIRTQKIGIKYINGQQYMVVEQGGKYILEKYDKDHAIAFSMSSQAVIADIVKRGQVNLLANQIREFLLMRYGDGYKDYANGQEEIVHYLTELYADGFKLSYLLSGADYEKGSNEKTPLDLFVKSYVIPAIGKDLQEGQTSMHDVDFGRIQKELSDPDFVNLQRRAYEVMNFLERYTGQQTPGFARSTESELVRFMIQDAAPDILDDDWMIRCWVTEHRNKLEKLGYRDIPGPFDIFSHFGLKKRKRTNISQDNQISYTINERRKHPYTTIDGRALMLIETHQGGESIIAASFQDQYIADAQRSGSAGFNTGINISINLAQDAYQDYLQRKQAWEIYRQKR